MNLTDTQLEQLAELAGTAARAAGRIIAENRDREVAVEQKPVGGNPASQVVTEVDRQAQAAIIDLLEPTLTGFGLALLAEESPDDGSRFREQAFWSIDPLDGTLAFVQGEPGFAVSIGLVARDGSPLIGVIHDPVTGRHYRAIRGHGARRDAVSVRCKAPDTQRPLTMRTDQSFREHPWLGATLAALEELADSLGLPGAQIDYCLGGVMNACGILDDPNRCYIKYPRTGECGGSLWDYAATACLLQEAGGVATDIFGHTLELNRPGSSFMNHRGLLYAGSAAIGRGAIKMHADLAARFA